MGKNKKKWINKKTDGDKQNSKKENQIEKTNTWE